MKSKGMWVALHQDGYTYSSPKGVFETAAECKRAIDKRRPFDRDTWPRAKPWKRGKSGLLWFRKDGWTAEKFDVGVFED